jgi:hypothetical protein
LLAGPCLLCTGSAATFQYEGSCQADMSSEESVRVHIASGLQNAVYMAHSQ